MLGIISVCRGMVLPRFFSRQLTLGGMLAQSSRCLFQIQILEIHTLLHSEKGCLGFVFPISHISKLLKILFDGLLSMFAAKARACSTLLTATLELDLGVAAMTDVCSLETYQLLGEIV